MFLNLIIFNFGFDLCSSFVTLKSEIWLKRNHARRLTIFKDVNPFSCYWNQRRSSSQTNCYSSFSFSWSSHYFCLINLRNERNHLWFRSNLYNGIMRFFIWWCSKREQVFQNRILRKISSVIVYFWNERT